MELRHAAHLEQGSIENVRDHTTVAGFSVSGDVRNATPAIDHEVFLLIVEALTQVEAAPAPDSASTIFLLGFRFLPLTFGCESSLFMSVGAAQAEVLLTFHVGRTFGCGNSAMTQRTRFWLMGFAWLQIFLRCCVQCSRSRATVCSRCLVSNWTSGEKDCAVKCVRFSEQVAYEDSVCGSNFAYSNTAD